MKKQRGVEGFHLLLERNQQQGQTEWRGCFECGEQWLVVVAVLEKT